MNQRYFSRITGFAIGGLLGSAIAVLLLALMGREQSFGAFLFWAFAPLLWHIPSMLRSDYRHIRQLLAEFKLKGPALEKAKDLMVNHGGVPKFIAELAYKHHKQMNEK